MGKKFMLLQHHLLQHLPHPSPSVQDLATKSTYFQRLRPPRRLSLHLCRATRQLRTSLFCITIRSSLALHCHLQHSPWIIGGPLRIWIPGAHALQTCKSLLYLVANVDSNRGNQFSVKMARILMKNHQQILLTIFILDETIVLTNHNIQLCITIYVDDGLSVGRFCIQIVLFKSLIFHILGMIYIFMSNCQILSTLCRGA